MASTPHERQPGRQPGGVAWSAAIGAGLLAGVVFLILEMVMVPVFLHGSPWGPPRMIGAIALGKSVLPPPATFTLGVFLTAVVVHFLLSVIYAIILGAIVHRMGMGMAILVGGGFGLLLYIANFYVLTALFPWFANARNWVTIFAHLLFGLIAAWAYKGLARSRAGAAA